MIIYSYVDSYRNEVKDLYPFYFFFARNVDPEHANLYGTYNNMFLNYQIAELNLAENADATYFLQWLMSLFPNYIEKPFIIGHRMLKYPLDMYPATDNTKANTRNIFRTFLLKYFFPKYWNCYIIIKFNPNATDEELDHGWGQWMDKFVHILGFTAERYLKLIETYEASKNKLLSKVSSGNSSIVRFNDTPQEEGDFANDQHTTNITSSETESTTDFDTPIKRIEEIDRYLVDFYTKWANEFDILFTRY